MADFSTLIVVGSIAAGVMWFVLRLGIMLHWGGADPFWTLAGNVPKGALSNRALIALGHLTMGVVFATVYSYVFSFLMMRGLDSFVGRGALIGLAHGFFVGFFFQIFPLNFEPKLINIRAGILNILAHVTYGATVGLGLGIRATTGSVAPFAMLGLLLLFVLAAIVALASARWARQRHVPA